MNDANEGSSYPRWTGRLEGISPAEILSEICVEGRTGVFGVVRHPIERQLYVHDGQIVFVTSSDPNDRLGERLLRQRKITLDQLEAALGQLRSGKRLGTLLVEAGALSPEELVTAVVCQVRATVLDTLAWERGDYVFREGSLPSLEAITLQVRTPALLLQGLRNLRAVKRVRRKVGSPRLAYRLKEVARASVELLTPTESERLVLERLEQGPASIEELCRELVVASWEVFRAIHAFTVLGVVELDDPYVVHEQAEHEGRLSERSLPDLLVQLVSSGVTGVLQIHRDGVERCLHFDCGRCVFATSDDPDDGLLHTLFRNGVISLGDAEEARRRLLSNRRVGLILRDLGVLDDRDLQEAVRDQVGEMILDSFSWIDGEYLFVPGALPAAEDFSLEMSTSRMLTEGVRRIGSWTRLVQGLGGIDNPQGLTADFMATLQEMGAGDEEWRVVHALKSSQTPRRICRVCELDDLRICQILWTLRLLGAVETAPESAVEAIDEEPDFDATTKDLQDELRELPDKAHGEVAADWNVPGAEPEDKSNTVDRPAAADPTPEPEAPAETPCEEPAAEESSAEEHGVPEADAPDPTAEPAATEPEWEGPDDLDSVVERFNAMHRVIYRAVRAEVGAGSVNFVRSCCGRGGPECDAALDGVDLRSDGTWDVDGLKGVVRSRHIEEPWPVYQKVLDRVYLDLKPLLTESRADALKERILDLQPDQRAGRDQSGSV